MARPLTEYDVSIWDEHNPVRVQAADKCEAAKRYVNEHKPPFHMKEPLMLSIKAPHGFSRKVLAWLTVDGLRAEVISTREAEALSEKFETRIDAEARTITTTKNKAIPDGHLRAAPDSASDAIENMMEPRPPSANEVSEPPTMTISRKKPEVYVDPDLRVENPIVPNEPPHPWMVFRVSTFEAGSIVIMDVSMAGAVKKAEREGYTVRSIQHLLFVDGVERVEDF